MKRIIGILLSVCIILTAFVCLGTSASAVAYHTITFDTQGIGETPEPVSIADGDCFLYLREHGDNNPTADGYVFHCWVTTPDYPQDEVDMSNTAAYLETPVTEDMTLYAVWYKIIDSVEVNVDPPKAGDVIGTARYETDDFSMDYQDPRPHAEVTSEGARVKDSFWSSIGKAAFWLEDPNDYESLFKGTFEDGKTYGVQVDIEPVFGYQFADKLNVTFNGKAFEEPVTADYNLCVLRAPIVCGKEPQQAVVPTSASVDEASAGKNSAGSGSANPNAIQTGGAFPVIAVLMILLCGAAAVYFLRKRKTD